MGANNKVLQTLILAKRPYKHRLKGAAPVLYVSWNVNHVNSDLAGSLDVADFFFLTLVVLWLGLTLTFSIWARGDVKMHSYLCLEEGAEPHPQL